MLRLCCIVLLICSACTHAEKVTLANGEWPPYQSEKLPHAGSASRIATAAFAKAGIEVEYQFFPWARAYEMAKAGKLDGTLVFTKTEDRVRDFVFSEPILLSKSVLFSLKAKPVLWQKISDLKQYRLGGVIGYNYGDEWMALEKANILQVERVGDELINFRKLLAGRIDAFAVEREVGMYILNTEFPSQAGLVEVGQQSTQTDSYHLLISRKNPRAKELVQRFNEGLSKLPASTIEQYLREGRGTQ